MKSFKIIFLFFALFFKLTCAAHEGDSAKKIEAIHAHKDLAGHAHVGWESRYFSEGRDALDGESMWTGTLEIGYDHFSGGIWYGESSNNLYYEWQYSLALAQQANGFEFYLGYTHLVFDKDDDSDDEWSAGLSYGELPYGLETALDATYSKDAGGTFFEWSTGKEFNPSEEFQLSVSGIFGWNDGYVSDGHDQLNFFALRTGAERELTKSFSFVVHGTQSWAIDSNPSLPGDLQLKDFFHFGLGLEWSF